MDNSINKLDASRTIRLGAHGAIDGFGLAARNGHPQEVGICADRLTVDGFTVDLDGFAAEVVRLAKARADTASRARKADLPRQCFFGCALGLGLALLVTRLVRGSQ